MQKTQNKEQNRKRNRDESQSDDNNEVQISQLKKLKIDFYKNKNNKLIQNALCSNSLWCVSEVREYMQSRDSHFSHTLDPKLVVSNQGLSGRCFLFAVLNVMRHELVQKLKLPFDFELSESYLSFYEKLEKCNYVLNKFMTADKINFHDLKTQSDLLSGVEDGGHWVTCANLIRKYGIIPKSCFKESFHSYCTDEINEILGYKIREFSLLLTKEKDLAKRPALKEKMLSDIYSILSKMLGTPPNVDEKIEWSFMLRLDLDERLEREQKRKETGEFETYQIKQTLHITPREFYEKLIVHNLNDYFRFTNDPRNPYYQYYQSSDSDIVVGGEINGYYNLPMEDIIQMCVASLKDNTAVQCDIDAQQYLHPNEELFDNKCFDHSLVFGLDFNNLTKKEMLEIGESYANHAVLLCGVDIPDKEPVKFKIENSWGRNHEQDISEDDSGYYTASIEWMKKFAYSFVIHKDYVKKTLQNKYNKAKENPTILPNNDIFG